MIFENRITNQKKLSSPFLRPFLFPPLCIQAKSSERQGNQNLFQHIALFSLGHRPPREPDLNLHSLMNNSTISQYFTFRLTLDIQYWSEKENTMKINCTKG